MALAAPAVALANMATRNAPALADGPLTLAWARSTGSVRRVYRAEMRRRGLVSTPCTFCATDPATDCRFMFGED